jgi:histidinol-phosphate/aromatic aminotransferase/cobyric acid decarboxylase-like protein
MPVTRRGLFGLIGGGGPPLIAEMIAARGMEAAQAGDQGAQTQTQTQGGRGGGRQGGAGRGGGQGQGRGQRPAPPEGISEIRISSNENPLGPGKTVLDAIVGKFSQAGRYPFNSTPNEGKLVETIAGLNKAKPENVVLGAGSQEILKSAIRAFTSPFRPLVTASPTFENPTGTARRMGVPVHEVKVDNQFRLNLEEMLAVVRGAGLVFLNNPNNPTATIHTAKTVQNFVERVKRISPDTVIHISNY